MLLRNTEGLDDESPRVDIMGRFRLEFGRQETGGITLGGLRAF